MKRVKLLLRQGLDFLVSKKYSKQYKGWLKRNNIPNKSVEGESEWKKKWSVLGKADPIYFRLFSHYIGNNLNIIPEDICRNVVEPILDPLRYVPYYTDKNIFDKLFKGGTLPQTILRKMNGFYYDSEYKFLELSNEEQLQTALLRGDVAKIVIKPSIDSYSGHGVRLFQKVDGRWYDLSSDDELTLNYLNTKYGTDFIIQECVVQSSFMSQFNPTSINTLRCTLYRSVKTNECYVPSAVIRIGANGSLVDNAHAGGCYVGINVEDGTLCNKVLNQYGECKTIFNGVDFSKPHQIPNWDKVVDFAKYIGENIPHHRLLALDIMVDDKGTPRLIEFNSDAYSMWFFQFTNSPAFGDYTDEIIEYCKNNIGKAQKWIRI